MEWKCSVCGAPADYHKLSKYFCDWHWSHLLGHKDREVMIVIKLSSDLVIYYLTTDEALGRFKIIDGLSSPAELHFVRLEGKFVELYFITKRQKNDNTDYLYGTKFVDVKTRSLEHATC